MARDTGVKRVQAPRLLNAPAFRQVTRFVGNLPSEQAGAWFLTLKVMASTARMVSKHDMCGDTPRRIAADMVPRQLAVCSTFQNKRRAH